MISIHELAARFDLLRCLPMSQRTSELEAFSKKDQIGAQMLESMLTYCTIDTGDLAKQLFTSRAQTNSADVKWVAKPADVLGSQYRLEELISQGGFADVFRGTQLEPIERPVAIKVIRRQLASDREKSRFVRECRVLGKLEHPLIARIYDAGHTPSNRGFIVMELIDGQPVTAYCRERKLSACARIELLAQTCRAVKFAHRHNVLHRDIKPSNVLVRIVDGSPRPVLIDFGISSVFEPEMQVAAETCVAANVLVGTPLYAAPELLGVIDEPIHEATDVYGVAALGYELIAGHPPHANRLDKRRSFVQLLELRESSDPDTLSRSDGGKGLLKHLPGTGQKSLDKIFDRALAKTPQQRTSTIEAFQRDIERWVQDPRCQRHRIRNWSIGSLTVAGVVVGAYMSWIALTAPPGLEDHVVVALDMSDGRPFDDWPLVFEQDVLGNVIVEVDNAVEVRTLEPIVGEQNCAVRYERQFEALGDFTLRFRIRWSDLGAAEAAWNGIGIIGTDVFHVMYTDPWIRSTGRRYARVGSHLHESGQNFLPASGSANIIVQRRSGRVRIWWNRDMILEAVNDQALRSISIQIDGHRNPTEEAFGVKNRMWIDELALTARRDELTGNS